MRRIPLLLIPMLGGCLETKVISTNDPPVVSIQRPGDGSEFAEGDLIEFVARIADERVSSVTLTWLDNGTEVLQDGEFPDGEGLSTFATAALAEGPHAISLRAVDQGGLSAEQSIQIDIVEVAESPVITIISPAPGDRVETETNFLFEVELSDPQDEPQDLLGEVYSSLDDYLCNLQIDPSGVANCVGQLSTVGNHQITFEVTDSDNNLSTKSVSLGGDPVPEEPTIQVIYPQGGDSILFNTPFEISAVVADRQDAPNNLAVSVASDVEGRDICPVSVDASGNATCFATLPSIGNHYLTFTVRDSDSNTTTANVLIQVTDSSGIDDDGDGQSEVQGDCDDTDITIYSGAPELPDNQDNDCDNVVDEGTILVDDDGDGYCESLSQPCTDGAAPGDCDDAAYTVNPGASESCNGFDDDCDSEVDELGSVGCLTYYADVDGDSFGVTTDTACSCGGTHPYTALSDGDCDDSLAAINPGAAEVPDGNDNNCNGTADEGTPLFDDDGDGYCDSTSAICSDGSQNGDCDDGAFPVNPGVPEICGDGVDNNCSGVQDEPGALGCTQYWFDNDLDGYGDPSTQVCSCSAPTSGNVVQNGDDCNDSHFLTNPSISETADGIDNNCNGVADEGTVRFDNDGDGFCADSACTPQPGGTPTGGDCNDGNSAVNPGATEVCSNGIDDNCNNQQNEGQDAIGASMYYVDNDSDGYGGNNGRRYCQATGIYVRNNNDDCYDSNPNARPGQTGWFRSSRGDGSYDYDCDGTTTRMWNGEYDCECTVTVLGIPLIIDDFDDGWRNDPGCGNQGTWYNSCRYGNAQVDIFGICNPLGPEIAQTVGRVQECR